MSDQTQVKCTRCRYGCPESDWIDVPSKRFGGCTEKACPKCGCKSYYECTPQVAWCWASGLIEIGDALPADKPDGSGALQIATGPKYALRSQVEVMARHGRGEGAGKLLVPGVPEAADQSAAFEALSAWLTLCNKRKPRDGVVFSKGGF